MSIPSIKIINAKLFICSDLPYEKMQSISPAHPVEYLRTLLSILFHWASKLLLGSQAHSCEIFNLTNHARLPSETRLSMASPSNKDTIILQKFSKLMINWLIRKIVYESSFIKKICLIY
jgi:hypothetical protein